MLVRRSKKRRNNSSQNPLPISPQKEEETVKGWPSKEKKEGKRGASYGLGSGVACAKNTADEGGGDGAAVVVVFCAFVVVVVVGVVVVVVVVVVVGVVVVGCVVVEGATSADG
jgi:Flp pilus assembly protein TadB